MANDFLVRYPLSLRLISVANSIDPKQSMRKAVDEEWKRGKNDSALKGAFWELSSRFGKRNDSSSLTSIEFA